MFTSRKLIVYVLLALMLFVGVSAVVASPASTPKADRTPVSFTIPAGQCPNLPAGVSVSGIGTSQIVTYTRTLPNGNGVFFISTMDNGTASDSNGGAHHFTYENNSTYTLLPSGQVQVHMNDTFVLSGPGPHYNAGFNWRWTFDSATEPPFPPAHNWEQLSTHGDPFNCDPI